jgi:glycine cleavage system pyridoxal-binding protein P
VNEIEKNAWTRGYCTAVATISRMHETTAEELLTALGVRTLDDVEKELVPAEVDEQDLEKIRRVLRRKA